MGQRKVVTLWKIEKTMRTMNRKKKSISRRVGNPWMTMERSKKSNSWGSREG